MCRLPWYFKVGRPQADRGVRAAPADGPTVPHNGANHYNGPQLMNGDAPTPRSCVRAEPRVTQEPMILSSSAPSPTSEGEHQPVSYVPLSSPQAPAARHHGANMVAGPLHRKRGRGEADLDDDRDSRSAAGGRRVRPRRGKRDDTTSTEGPSAAINNSGSRPLNIAAGTGATQRAAQHRVPSSDDSSSSPAMSATASASQLDAPNMGPDASLRPVQVQDHSSQPVGPINTVLRATNPRSGPVSGGTEIWLALEDLPMMFTLYARFGTRVTATVSSTFHLLSQSTSDLHWRRFRMRLRCHVCFPPQVIQAL